MIELLMFTGMFFVILWLSLKCFGLSGELHLANKQIAHMAKSYAALKAVVPEDTYREFVLSRLQSKYPVRHPIAIYSGAHRK